ncbi:MAG: HAD family hydrolase [Collinsella sp.]|nr:HAD family hydrolase [Collinsella sp.]
MRDYKNDLDMHRIEIVASDMDFTLLADDKTMPENMPKLIDAMSEAGMLFCAASGRPTYTLRSMFGDLSSKMGFIADNGAAITVRDEVIFKSLIAPEVYHRLLDMTIQLGGVPNICGLDAAYLRSCDRHHDAILREFYHNIVYLDDIGGLDVEANKFTVFFPERDSERAYAEAFAPAFGSDFSVTCAGSEWIDIMNKGVDKGTGITRLCEHLGVEVADAAAFGDTHNDIQMLETAGHSFLMANARDHMRQHARFLAPSNNDRGVAVVVEAILAAKRSPAGR